MSRFPKSRWLWWIVMPVSLLVAASVGYRSKSTKCHPVIYLATHHKGN